MTIQDIINYVVNSPENSNPNVLLPMLESLMTSDNINLSGITATADKILNGYKSVDTAGKEVVGNYIPLDTSDATATAEDIAKDKTAYVNGIKITGVAE